MNRRAHPPKAFQTSWLKRKSYPINIVQRSVSTYSDALAAYKARLDEVQKELFPADDDGDRIEVLFRDLRLDNGLGSESENPRICSLEALRQWLGVEVETNDKAWNPKDSIVTIEHGDPKARFIYLSSKNHRTRLNITRTMLMDILTFHQVMPDYLDFVTRFGELAWFRLLKFSGFRQETTLNATAYAIPELARSGRHFQLCYNLKSVDHRGAPRNEIDLYAREWSMQEAAFYHRFDVVGGNTLWIVTKAREDIYQRYKELTSPSNTLEGNSLDTVEDCFRTSLTVHLLFCSWSAKGWRGYMEHLDKELETSLMPYVRRHPFDRDRQILDRLDVQTLQTFEDQIYDAIAVLTGNVDVMTALREYYIGLQTNSNFPLAQSCESDLDVFANALKSMISGFQMEINSGNRLLRVVSNRKEVLNKTLERQQMEESMMMNRNMQREAVVVRIITIVTLIYLPATFVSTLFSTDIIKYQDHGGSGSFSNIALMRWLQVTLPLTFVTLFFAWLANRWQDHDWTWGRLVHALHFNRTNLAGRPRYRLPQRTAPIATPPMAPTPPMSRTP